MMMDSKFEISTLFLEVSRSTFDRLELMLGTVLYDPPSPGMTWNRELAFFGCES